MLEARGVLAALQTNAAWYEGSALGHLMHRIYSSERGAIARRTVKGVPRRKLRTTLLPDIVGRGLRALSIETERRFRIEDWFLGAIARQRGLAGANVVLNTCGNGGVNFLRWSKSQGAKIATDIVITPQVLEILAEEHARWPNWVQARNLGKASYIYRRHSEEVVAVSDLLLYASANVLEGLSHVRGFDPKKAVCIPYGLGWTPPLERGHPVPKRILFSGEAGLRKGLPYLADAAHRLKARDANFEIRVAGNVSDIVRSKPECADLTFLGYLRHDQMIEEFQRCDIFCLPSLAEGMASVTLEALAHGVPCVVTRSAGAPVQDGIEGIVVPERDGVSLADALASIACDRTLRARMAEAAHTSVTKHTSDAVAAQLLEALQKAIA